MTGRRAKEFDETIEIAQEDVTGNSREVTCNLWLLTYGGDSGEKFRHLFAVFLRAPLRAM